jgi:tRNA A58 N-methylase Trm61
MPITEPAPRPDAMWVRAECPEPGRWLAPDGIATEADVSLLLAALVRALKPDLVVETGAYLGHTTAAIGHALAAEARGRLYALELAEDRADHAARKVAGLPVTVVCADSRTWEPPGRVDLLFADSEYDARILEVRRYRLFASPRCLVVAHDTVMADYRRGLEQLAAEGVVTPWVYLPTPRGLGLARYR